MVALVVIAVICLVVWGIYSIFRIDTYSAKVIGFSWQRVVGIQEYKALYKEGWSYPPSDAYNITSERKFHYSDPNYGYKRVKIGKISYVQRYVISYTDVYDKYYTYTVNRWDYSRNVVTSGNDRSPHWGQYSLQLEGQEVFGAERVGGTSEAYVVYLQTIIGKDTKTFSVLVSQTDWVEYSTNTTYTIKVNSSGSITNNPLHEGQK